MVYLSAKYAWGRVSLFFDTFYGLPIHVNFSNVSDIFLPSIRSIAPSYRKANYKLQSAYSLRTSSRYFPLSYLSGCFISSDHESIRLRERYRQYYYWKRCSSDSMSFNFSIYPVFYNPASSAVNGFLANKVRNPRRCCLYRRLSYSYRETRRQWDCIF